MLPQFTICKTKKFNFLRVFKTKELTAFFELISTLLGISENVINLLLIASLHRDTLLNFVLRTYELWLVGQNVVCSVFVPPFLQLLVVSLITLLLFEFLKFTDLVKRETILYIKLRSVKKNLHFDQRYRTRVSWPQSWICSKAYPWQLCHLWRATRPLELKFGVHQYRILFRCNVLAHLPKRYFSAGNLRARAEFTW